MQQNNNQTLFPIFGAGIVSPRLILEKTVLSRNVLIATPPGIQSRILGIIIFRLVQKNLLTLDLNEQLDSCILVKWMKTKLKNVLMTMEIFPVS
jgi:hypothetical protein